VNYTIGLDLGKARDYCALVVAERLERDTGEFEDVWGVPTSRMIDEYEVVDIHRFPRGTRYPTIVDVIGKRLAEEPLKDRTVLRFDATGAEAVADIFEDAYRDGRCGRFWPEPIVFTSGQLVDGLRVPKATLINRTQVLLQQERLRFAAKHPQIDKLREELLDMRVKVSPASGRDTYEALTESAHDDLVTGVCLAVLWPHRYAVCSRIGYDGNLYVRDANPWGRPPDLGPNLVTTSDRALCCRL
jgi:hypothetical protein